MQCYVNKEAYREYMNVYDCICNVLSETSKYSDINDTEKLIGNRATLFEHEN